MLALSRGLTARVAGKSADDAKKAYVDELKAQIAEFY